MNSFNLTAARADRHRAQLERQAHQHRLIRAAKTDSRRKAQPTSTWLNAQKQTWIRFRQLMQGWLSAHSRAVRIPIRADLVHNLNGGLLSEIPAAECSDESGPPLRLEQPF